MRAAPGGCLAAPQLFLQLGHRSSSHNRLAVHHKPASAASAIKRFESVKLRRKRCLRKVNGIFYELRRFDEDAGVLINPESIFSQT